MSKINPSFVWRMVVGRGWNDAKKTKCKIRWIKQVEWLFIELYQNHSWSNLTWIKMTKSIRLNRINGHSGLKYWISRRFAPNGLAVLSQETLMTLKFASRVSNLDLCWGFCWVLLPICVAHKTLQSFVAYFLVLLRCMSLQACRSRS